MARNQLSSSRSLTQGNLYGYTLPKAWVSLAVLGSEQGYRLSIEEVAHVPDPAHQYYFRYTPLAFTNDEITFSVGPNGYLRRIHTVIEDQTAKVIDALATIGTDLAQVAVGVAPKTRSLPNERLIFSGEIDPFDPTQMAQVNARLQQIQSDLQLSAHMVEDGQEGAKTVLQNTQNKAGFYYKPYGTCMLTLSHAQGQQRVPIRLPHPNRLGFVEIPQARWVRTEFQVDCDELGYPTRVHIKKPSTALEFVRLPLTIVKSILALPAQLFQFRINLQQGRAAAMQADLAQQRTLAEMKEEMRTLRREQQEASQTRSAELPRTESAPAAPSQPASSGGHEGEWGDTIRKLQQDVMILRRRINEQSE